MNQSTQRFQSKIVISGTRAILPLPFDPNDVWGVKERHHITGSVQGHPYRGPLGFDSDQYFLSLGAAWRRENNLEVGDLVEVVLSPEGPQRESLAADLLAALDAEPQAREFFEALATFYRKGYIRWIDGARRPETRAERIREMVALLKAGKKQRR
jgi:hypothetical protein